MNSTQPAMPPIGRFLVNALYLLGVLSGLLIACFGLYLFSFTVLSSLFAFGLLYGVPLVLLGIALMLFAGSMLFREKHSSRKYEPRIWVSAMMCLVAISLIAYAVWSSLTGL